MHASRLLAQVASSRSWGGQPSVKVGSVVRSSIIARRWGPGERIVFEPYTEEVFEESFEWIAQHHIFAEDGVGSGQYDRSTISFAQ
jgi:hypothetical protein